MGCFDGIDNIFFDFDGTLCESAEDIRAAWRSAFADLKLDVPDFERIYRVGPPTEVSARTFCPDADDREIRRLCEVYWGYYYNSSYPNSHPYPGVDAMLERLTAAGKKLFLATNKNEIPLRRLIEKFHWEQTFEALLTHSMMPPGAGKSYLLRLALDEHALDPRRTAIVGDTALDVVAGKAVGITTIGATYGYGSVDELVSAGADVLVSLAEVTAAD